MYVTGKKPKQNTKPKQKTNTKKKTNPKPNPILEGSGSNDAQDLTSMDSS